MKIKILLSTLCLLGICCASKAFADNPEKRACIKTAQTDFLQCKTTCSNNKREAKIACGGNPDCHKACSEGFNDCTDTLHATFKQCQTSCSDPFLTGKTGCQTTTQCGVTGGTGPCYKNAAFLSCIRPFEVAKFNCARDCKDAERLDPLIQPGLKACNEAAKTCHKACNTPVTPAP